MVRNNFTPVNVALTSTKVGQALLEAKIKDTKKPRPRTFLSRTDHSRPKKGTLKAKDTTRKCSPKTQKEGLSLNFSQIFRKKQAISKQNTKKVSPTNTQIFQQSSNTNKFFSQVLRRAPRQNNIAHDLGPFSTSQKIVLFSSRRQGVFKDLQGSRSRPRTLNCVLEDVLEAKNVLEDFTSRNAPQNSGSGLKSWPIDNSDAGYQQTMQQIKFTIGLKCRI